jgi:hypothetical protein
MQREPPATTITILPSLPHSHPPPHAFQSGPILSIESRSLRACRITVDARAAMCEESPADPAAPPPRCSRHWQCL